jgi:6-phosphogluconolactonase (cycloisomerase 2 family)
MIPINIDGSDVGEITIDGADVQEVTVDGDMVWAAAPDDGALFYVVGENTDPVFQYNVSSPFDVTTASYNNDSLDMSSEDDAPTDLIWNAEGDRLYVLGGSNGTIYQYDVSSPFDVTTATHNGDSLDVSSEDTGGQSINWSDDGTHLYMSGNENNMVYQYVVSSPFDVTTASYNSDSLDVGGRTGSPVSISWNSDGSLLYVLASDNIAVLQYNISTPFDVTTASYSDELNVGSESSTPEDLAWSFVGDQLYVMEFGNPIYQYDVSSPFDVTTATHNGDSLDVSSEEGFPNGISWNGAPQF